MGRDPTSTQVDSDVLYSTAACKTLWESACIHVMGLDVHISPSFWQSGERASIFTVRFIDTRFGMIEQRVCTSHSPHQPDRQNSSRSGRRSPAHVAGVVAASRSLLSCGRVVHHLMPNVCRGHTTRKLTRREDERAAPPYEAGYYYRGTEVARARNGHRDSGGRGGGGLGTRPNDPKARRTVSRRGDWQHVPRARTYAPEAGVGTTSGSDQCSVWEWVRLLRWMAYAGSSPHTCALTSH
ncbi:hypothetical protein C8Q73DRAFT_385384 [Cubamyces lactineus]|nr:hypothetical protein C8Q73DRAFT_385384 [Cubamyces lactineus]